MSCARALESNENYIAKLVFFKKKGSSHTKKDEIHFYPFSVMLRFILFYLDALFVRKKEGK